MCDAYLEFDVRVGACGLVAYRSAHYEIVVAEKREVWAVVELCTYAVGIETADSLVVDNLGKGGQVENQ